MTGIAPHFAGATFRAVGQSTTGAEQFGRWCRVEIGGPVVPNDFSPSGKSRDKRIANAEGPDLRVRFRVERTGLWTPNIGHVELNGLNEETRKFCQHKGVPVALYAGYGTDLKLVAVFNAVQINHKHDGPEWLSKFEGGEGHRNFTQRYASQTWSAGVSPAKVATDLGKLLGKFGAGTQTTINSAGAGRVYRGGYAVAKKAERAFKEVCDDLGLAPSIWADEIVVAPKNGTTREVFVIGPESGMVGSPEYASQPQPGKPQLLRVKTLLNPLLKPWAMVLLQSAAHSGPYVIRTVTHDGDSYGGNWYSDMELQGLKGSK